ncbi:hypothetical protein AB0J86_19385 [Micromonospora sp. NPDC049559]|uniref:hypothetical protein n=1 Tax=Micromonospora sp. NPDC049559 TaxID=3155923 RepID=UPI0034165782
MSANGPGLLVIERILRDRQSIWRQIVEERDLNALTVRMLASSAIALACYGAVLGAFNSFLMAVTSAVKLPLLFLITLAICLPTLYLFNLVFGARLSVRQALALVMVAITVTAMLAVAFAPISLFFLITAPDYAFFKLLNVAILTLSALVGLRFLTGGMQVLNAHGLLGPAPAPAAVAAPAPVEPAAIPAAQVPAAVAAAPAAGEPAEQVAVPAGAANGEVPATVATAVATAPQPAVPATVPAAQPGMPALVGAGSAYRTFPPGAHAPYPGYPARPGDRVGPDGQRPASMTLLYIWILLFGFVGTQLAWTLRPFFGSPGQEFALFRSIEGNFYTQIFLTIGDLF